MRGPTRRSAIAALAAAVVATTAGGGTVTSAAKDHRFERCGKVADAGGRSPVKAANVRCKRARKLAARFIQEDEVASGWKTDNPAGCEHFMYRKDSRDAFQDWLTSGGPIHFKLIAFVKQRGCVS